MKPRYEVLDGDEVVGAGDTADQAAADAASKIKLPWSEGEGPAAAAVVENLVENGDYDLTLNGVRFYS
jgi:hypothetical protein